MTVSDEMKLREAEDNLKDLIQKWRRNVKDNFSSELIKMYENDIKIARAEVELYKKKIENGRK